MDPLITEPPTDTDAATLDQKPKRNPNGKIAHLPADVRNILNQMIVDGYLYEAISERMAELGHPGIRHYNIARWRMNGHQTWLQHQTKQQAAESLNKFVLEQEQKGNLAKGLLTYASSKLVNAIDNIGASAWQDIVDEEKSTAPKLLSTLVQISKQSAELDQPSTINSQPSTAPKVATANSIKEIRRKLNL